MREAGRISAARVFQFVSYVIILKILTHFSFHLTEFIRVFIAAVDFYYLVYYLSTNYGSKPILLTTLYFIPDWTVLASVICHSWPLLVN